MEIEFGLGEISFYLVPGHEQAVWLDVCACVRALFLVDVTLHMLYFLCVCSFQFYIGHLFVKS